MASPPRRDASVLPSESESPEDFHTPRVAHAALTDDDDDIEYEPLGETTDETDTGDENWLDELDDAEEGEQHEIVITQDDLQDLLNAEEIGQDSRETTQEPDEQGADNGTAQTAEHTHTMRITRSQIIQFLQRGFFSNGHLGMGDDDQPDEDDDDSDYDPRGFGRYRRRRAQRRTDPFPKVPSDQGRELMESGNFGTNERLMGSYERRKKLANRVMMRELGLSSPGKERSLNKLAAQSLLPSSNADTIIHYDHRCYSGQFSDDGNFFFSCSQDFNVRMYDTSNPYHWKYYKRVEYPFGQWTITDASLSPDNRFLAYSSIRSTVCLAATDPEDDSQPTYLDFSDNPRTNLRHLHTGHFGIWSIRFSGDGRELVAGTSDNSVCAFDLETRQTVLHIRGHDDDVNAVCFGDKSSPHLLYSGSDDTTIKVWDRRSMSEKRAAGVFLGHTEGLTYIDSKGDGRYVLSNAKDQTMKLWDLRKMVPTDKADRVDNTQYSLPFDYRFEPYDMTKYYKHPHDCSLVTFRGHSVLKTLIRCHFSPPGSTDSRYVYSGSEDGSVYIYNLDATLAGKVNVLKATRNTRPRGSADLEFMDWDNDSHGSWKTCVRDASWHPNAPVIAATSWNGYGMTQGTCSVHTWNDGLEDDEAEPKMGQRVDAELRKDARLYEAQSQRPMRRGGFRVQARRLVDDD